MPKGIPTNGIRVRKAPLKISSCSISECSGITVARGFCDTHYRRFKRHGDPLHVEFVRDKSEKINSNGYIWQTQPDHPLATAGGTVYKHRRVLYDAIGQGPHPCHWCSVDLVWDGRSGIHVDHLDGDKLNNGIDNLVPSCHRCNSARGLFQHWVLRHKDDPFLAKLFDEVRSKHDQADDH